MEAVKDVQLVAELAACPSRDEPVALPLNTLAPPPPQESSASEALVKSERKDEPMVDIKEEDNKVKKDVEEPCQNPWPSTKMDFKGPAKPEPSEEACQEEPVVDDREADENEDEEVGEEEEEEEEEESLILESRLRVRRQKKVKEDELVQKEEREVKRRLASIVTKARGERSREDLQLLKAHPDFAAEARKKRDKKKRTEARKLEMEDQEEVLSRKCVTLATAIAKAKYLVAYTGAGISTAANIPDYRGPNGVWTRMDAGLPVAPCDLSAATPTYTHRALFTLFKRGRLRHVVSQNCDGLHLRSGLPRSALSEIHGNMFVEICKKCRPARPFVRTFDVTERTNKNRHATMRRCYVCGTSLQDTIVHFGEKGQVRWPINWQGATRAASKADVILCLGSSLKVLRRYHWLWCMDRPKRERPKLFIVNLQWTPKDSVAKLKLNGRCDEVMKQVMNQLGLAVPDYCSWNDPLLSYSTPLHDDEAHTTSKLPIVKPKEADNVVQSATGTDASNGENETLHDQKQTSQLKTELGPKDNGDELSASQLPAHPSLVTIGNLADNSVSSNGRNGCGSNPQPSATNGNGSNQAHEAGVSKTEVGEKVLPPRATKLEALASMLAWAQQSSPTAASGTLPSSACSSPSNRKRRKRTLAASEALDYSSIDWPKDALYCSYEPKFEFVEEGQVVGSDVFICDCHDPDKQRKRKTREEEEEETDSSDCDREAEDDEEGEETFFEDEDSSQSSSRAPSVAGESSNSSFSNFYIGASNHQPGWFGKGRRKRNRNT